MVRSFVCWGWVAQFLGLPDFKDSEVCCYAKETVRPLESPFCLSFLGSYELKYHLPPYISGCSNFALPFHQTSRGDLSGYQDVRSTDLTL